MRSALNYRTRILPSLSSIGQAEWDALLAKQPEANPFLSYAFLDALHTSGSASQASGWQSQFLTLWQDDHLAAAMPLYVKAHSYGEYVFDWAWADAYYQHGLPYYPKLLSAIPFTPVSGNRLLARDETARTALITALCEVRQSSQTSSTHILFPSATEAHELQQAGFMLRGGIQFHWLNPGYHDFDEFLATLVQKKRKNIRAERRRVREAGITFRHVLGTQANESDWRFFKRCYDHTYDAHGSTPYLNLEFFLEIGRTMPEQLVLVIAERAGQPIAAALAVYDTQTLYGRYWGALESHPCLHFETAYYQLIDFCITQRIACFEGGAQGEHKMARGFLPQKTWSAHWLAHPAFANAVEQFLERETGGIELYLSELDERTPFRQGS